MFDFSKLNAVESFKKSEDKIKRTAENFSKRITKKLKTKPVIPDLLVPKKAGIGNPEKTTSFPPKAGLDSCFCRNDTQIGFYGRFYIEIVKYLEF